MTFYCIFLKNKCRRNELRRRKVENVDYNKNVQVVKTLFKKRRLSNTNNH